MVGNAVFTYAGPLNDSYNLCYQEEEYINALFLSVKWLVQYGAVLDMTIPSGPVTFKGLLETTPGGAILKKLINENAIKYDNGCRKLTLPMPLTNEVDLEVISLCLEAGFQFKNVHELDISGLPAKIRYLFETMQNVSSLKSLCRITIRHNLGSPLLKFIGSLGLPELITDYLMFTNECVVSRGQLEELFGDIDCLEDEDL